MRYQREIDGLRAISVLAVIFYHAGFGFIQGGFIGVDVFFVISGYLITGQIYPAIAQRKFSFAGFLTRRARRLLPAIFPMVFICIPVAYLTMMPVGLTDFSQSILAVVGFSSNFLFWVETEYFAAGAEFKPLLHTWSLAVEEQFYFCLPILLLLIRSWTRRWAIALFILGLVLSCGLSHYCAQYKPTADFFLLPSRCWELLYGSLLFLHVPSRPRSAVVSEALGGLGLLLIGGSFIYFDAQILHPSAYTLFPVVGAGLLIRHAGPSTWVGRLLGYRLLVGVGLISYSTYLWHHPVFTFTRIISPQPPGTALLIGLCAVCLLLGYVSWRYVERPFRDPLSIPNRRFYLAGLSSTAVLILFGIAGYKMGGFPQRLTPAQQATVEYERYPMDSIYQIKCFLHSKQTSPDFDPSCDGVAASAPGIPQTGGIFLWGDSYSAHLRMGLNARYPHTPIAQFSTVCAPILGVPYHAGVRCVDYDAYILERLVRFRPRHIILAAHWITHLRENSSLENTLIRLRSLAPDASITVVGNTPHWYPTLPARLASSHIALTQNAVYPAAVKASIENDRAVEQMARRQAITFHSIIDKACDEQGNCQAVLAWKDGYQPFSWDTGHLTEAGSDWVVRLLPDFSHASEGRREISSPSSAR